MVASKLLHVAVYLPVSANTLILSLSLSLSLPLSLLPTLSMVAKELLQVVLYSPFSAIHWLSPPQLPAVGRNSAFLSDHLVSLPSLMQSVMEQALEAHVLKSQCSALVYLLCQVTEYFSECVSGDRCIAL